jgi:hypothetical protein
MRLPLPHQRRRGRSSLWLTPSRGRQRSRPHRSMLSSRPALRRERSVRYPIPSPPPAPPPTPHSYPPLLPPTPNPPHVDSPQVELLEIERLQEGDRRLHKADMEPYKDIARQMLGME